ncbi:hypothetical protein PAXY110619_23490 [Paenibacillus xylanexedens]|uniref:Uncharacterized protein n=1 Tax=Paenibacillus xylanexedens TaxID=528191 RepID=A0ABS4RVC8_PAEXY|nr:hypothetical protein [Paenibacillus xylanexedens]
MKEFATLQPYACPAQIIDLDSDSANLEKIYGITFRFSKSQQSIGLWDLLYAI